MITRTIERVTPDDLEHVLSCLYLSFSGDTLLRWIWETTPEYTKNFAAFSKYFAEICVENTCAWQIANFSGCLIATPPSVKMDKTPAYKIIGETCPAEKLEELNAISPPIEGYEPKEPYWYLSFVGVDPGMQGNGLGGKLVEFLLAEVERDPAPIYLESSNPKNVGLYQRYGFEILDQYSLQGRPTLTPMLKPAPR